MTDNSPLQPTFTYKIVRSRRKTLIITIQEGKVEVRAPLKLSTKLIEQFVAEKTPWALKHLDKQQQQLTEKLRIEHGEEAMFFGRPRLIEYAHAGRGKVILSDTTLQIFSPDPSSERLEKVFLHWLQQQAREYLSTQTIKLARELGVSERLKEVVFRKTKSKWGHCCHDGTIQYNWMIMMAPKEVIDYLVAHETSHLLHMNHSAQFWKTVALISPHYKEHKHWLEENGHRIWLK